MASTCHWNAGDIAFLKSVNEFNNAEYDALIKTRYLCGKATQHPVIILEHSEDYQFFLITTVSAYGSGMHNDYLPPWQQSNHTRKCRNDFRAFYGSELPNIRQKHLMLEVGGCFPKPKTSWVYIRNAFVVPLSTLQNFERARTQLRMTQESLQDLLNDMKAQRKFSNPWKRPVVVEMLQLAEHIKNTGHTQPVRYTQPVQHTQPKQPEFSSVSVNTHESSNSSTSTSRVLSPGSKQGPPKTWAAIAAGNSGKTISTPATASTAAKRTDCWGHIGTR
ncbi:hypothetical protein AAE478_007596 [Parahypoxylon ruwenzoriense]